MDKIFKILLVEDGDDQIGLILAGLEGRPVKVLVAKTIEQAEELLAANPDFDAILMDGHVPSAKTSSTLPLVEKISKTFEGDMIAIAMEEESRKKLIGAGCGHASPKHLAARKLCEVLGL